MARSRTDFEKSAKTREKKQKDGSFDDILKKHADLSEEGWYKGKFTEVRKKDANLIVSADIFDLSDDTYYGNINGFLPINYSEDDVTAEFLEALDNPSKFSDIIGKEAKVYVDFNEGSNGKEYPNMFEYDKL